MRVSRDMLEARAFIFDLLSVSFSYPTRELYLSLLDGSYVKELGQYVSKLPQEDRRYNRHANRHIDLLDKLANYPYKNHAENYSLFEAEYISLFVHNNELQPLHLNAHLYNDDEPQPVPVFHRLLTQYQDFGIELKSNSATEQPDHLSVMLEFFSYLHKLQLQNKNERSLQKINNGIEDFCVELQWVELWAVQLQQRQNHAFYHPLSQLLLYMLKLVNNARDESLPDLII